MISFLEYCQLDEAFTNPLPITVTNYPRSWTATFTVPSTPYDKTYEIQFNAQSLKIPDKLKTTNAPWELSFADITNPPGGPRSPDLRGPSRHGVTGGGDAFVIFATVIHALKVFARLFATRPFIVFTAKEASRQKLYDRFVRMVKSTIPGMHGFRLINTPAVRAVLGNMMSGSAGISSYAIVPTHIPLRTVAKLIGLWHKKNAADTDAFLSSL
jgi:hypothetical protein